MRNRGAQPVRGGRLSPGRHVSTDRETRRKAIGEILKLANQALGKRTKKKPPPLEAKPKKKDEDEIGDEDRAALLGMYESEGRAPEA